MAEVIFRGEGGLIGEEDMDSFTVKTKARNEFIDVTQEVERVVEKSGVGEGMCYLYVPHTTAGLTINEGADPSVARDIRNHLDHLVPAEKRYLHTEGNADSHIKSTLVGVHTVIPISGGKMVLGTWQSIFFCEFDGPRSRKVLVQILSAGR